MIYATERRVDAPRSTETPPIRPSIMDHNVCLSRRPRWERLWTTLDDQSDKQAPNYWPREQILPITPCLDPTDDGPNDAPPGLTSLKQEVKRRHPNNPARLSRFEIETAGSSADASPIQIWEGVVIEADPATDSMVVKLEPKFGANGTHAGKISLQDVSPQDRNLVQPGAVFYLTLFRRIRSSGTIENGWELRFRRLPTWSAMQIERIEKLAEATFAKVKRAPIAE